MAEDNEKGFSVSDRRIKLEDETVEAEQAPGKEGAPAEEGAGSGEGGTGDRLISGPGEGSAGDDAGKLPPVNFTTFLLSLHTSGMINLGMIPDPSTSSSSVNLEAARQNIDLLDMLKEKTRGNLSSEEKNLLENILYELRMAYVKTSREPGKE